MKCFLPGWTIFILLLAAGFAYPANVSIFSFKTTASGFALPPSIQNFTALYKTELAKIPGMQVVERENLADLSSEIALGQTGILSSSATPLDSVRFEGVDYIIGGTLTEIKSGRYRVDLAIREVKTAKIIGEKLSGRISRYNEAAARLLANNTACLLTGQGRLVQKKVIPRTGALIATAAGLAGVAAGAFLRHRGGEAYGDYKACTGTLDEIAAAYDEAQSLTNTGEILLYGAGPLAFFGALFTLTGRGQRTLTCE